MNDKRPFELVGAHLNLCSSSPIFELMSQCTGLSLVLNIQQSEYLSQVGSTAGVVVLPLTQNIMPFPEDHGLLVAPGLATSIGLTTVLTLDCLLCRLHNTTGFSS